MKKAKILLVIGLILVLCGVLGNEWTLSRIVSSDGRIESASLRIIIWLINVGLIGSGLLLIRFRRKIRPENLLLLGITGVLCVF